MSTLPTGQRGRIVSVACSPTQQRLMELGFVPGSIVQTKSKFTPGDIGCYETEGNPIAIRDSDARTVVVETDLSLPTC